MDSENSERRVGRATAQLRSGTLKPPFFIIGVDKNFSYQRYHLCSNVSTPSQLSDTPTF